MLMLHIPARLTRFLIFTIAITVSCCTFSITNAAFAQDTTSRLRASVARMNDWLGTGQKAQLWREYLDLNVLDSQSARGEQADPATLQILLNRLQEDQAGLEHGVFAEVRGAVAAQIMQLNKIRSAELVDLQFAAQQAIAGFRVPTKAELENDRAIAKYELSLLMSSYRRDFDSRTRGIVFHKLKLKDAIAFLDELEIEMPPEVSVGKMDSMIQDQRALLEAVEDKIDALPIDTSDNNNDEQTPQPDDEIALKLQAPGPDDDDEDSIESLETKKEALEERIAELRTKRGEVLTLDRPRLVARNKFGRELRQIQKRFNDLLRTQTDAAFGSAATAINRLTDSYIFGTQDNIQEEFLEKVAELAELIPTLSDPNDWLSHAKLGQLLLWMERHQQLTDLCVAIRSRFSNANAYVSVSSRLIQSQTTRSEAAYDRVAEDFLGRFARGLSYTDTTVNLVPMYDPNQVRLGIILSGTASANTYVRERMFRIDSSSSGYLSARRDLFANLYGLFSSDSSFDAKLAAQYGGINTSIGFVQRLAAKSFAKEQARTEAESSRRAESRLRERFEAETSQAINEGVDQLESISEKVRSVSALLPQLYLRSFSDRVEAVAKKDTRFSIAAPSQPMLQTAGSDVQVRLHQSMLCNYLDLVFAGKSFTRDELIAEAKELLGDSELLAADDGAADDVAPIEDFKITFPRTRPVQIEFNGNRIGLIITGSRFQQGDQSITTTVVARLAFKIVNRNGKLFVVLSDGPEISLSEDEDPSAESIAFAKILENRITESAEESGDAAVELPANLIPDVDALKDVDVVNSLQLGLLKLEQGWAYLGWNYQSGVVDTPAIWNEAIVDQMENQFLDEEPILIEGDVREE